MRNYNLLVIMSEWWESAYATLQHGNNLNFPLHASCAISTSYFGINVSYRKTLCRYFSTTAILR